MTDLFAELYEPIAPTNPDPDFARRLRARVERALALPRGVVPVTATIDLPAIRPAAVPYLAVDGARAAIDWYVDVFDAAVVGEPVVMPDGRIGHAQLEISGGMLYLADAHPEIGVTAPRPNEYPVSLMLPVDDADRVMARATDRGAAGDGPPHDSHGHRNAWITDPFGHRWGLNSPLVQRAATAYRHGDVMHVAHIVPDADRARVFYADVLGWTYLPDGRVDGSTPSVGFRETPGTPRLIGDYTVTDLDAAVRAVSDAGGTPGAIERYDWGTVAECVDDQGVEFRLHRIEDVAGEPPPEHGNGPGDLEYLTLLVGDSGRARMFYGAVLGWAFRSAHPDDRWHVDGPAPAIGMAGGHAHATGMAMWQVRDIDAAVAAVRSRGGTATEPDRQPYGITADCTDDQGLRFYLGQS